MKADPLPIEGIDYVEMYVGNAKQSSYFYQKGFGFAPVAYSGPETGVRDKTSYLLQQGDIRLLITSALVPDHPIARYVLTHGDGVADIALRVKNVEWTYAEATKRGARPITQPKTLTDEHGHLKGAAIAAYGDTVHTFIERDQYKGIFGPGYVPLKGKADPVGLQRVDHVVANVEEGKMDYWVEFYGKVFGFTQLISFDDKDISTEYSALRSKVVRNPSGTVKFPINEPAAGKRKSQIQEYLDFFKGAGVQHLAISTDNLVATVARLQERGIEFLNTPDSYYDQLPKRVGGLTERMEDLKKHRILVDKDDKGYMLQIFTKPLQDRPTLFFEIIQRKGSESFGKGNFKALFESIEQEQAKRGNL
ncbi:MAG TPA: 4-hydroxyphenylpyruvate dioxygenase [Candidatus Bathyarchaeia archaeon]|nr:4-hydroxyphenylpyruvate dioxygenase [Candidatus Bathyarchaeia archaeon]